MAGIKCFSCGWDGNKPEWEFCGHCGTDLTKPPAAPVEPTPEATRGEPVPTPPAVKPPSGNNMSSAGLPTAQAKAHLVIASGGRVGHEFPLTADTMNIGRWDPDTGAFPEIDLTDDDSGCFVSRHQARIMHREGRYYLEDLGGKNRTAVNRVRLTQGMPQLLQDGDEIVAGKVFLRFKQA